MDNITVDVGPEPAPAVGVGATAILIGARRRRAPDRRGPGQPARDDQLRDPVRDLGPRAAPLSPRRRARAVSEPLAALPASVDRGRGSSAGRVRDRLLGRPTADFDVVVVAAVAAEGVARALGRGAPAASRSSSPRRSAPGASSPTTARWQVDLMPLDGRDDRGRTSRRRDLTVNAIAAAAGRRAGYVDPFGGLEDLARAAAADGRRRDAFERDPLRDAAAGAAGLRAGLRRSSRRRVELARASAPGLARCRARAGVRRAAAAGRAPTARARRARADGRDRGHRPRCCPSSRRCAASSRAAFTTSTCIDHTRAVLAETIELERDPSAWLGADADGASRELLARAVRQRADPGRGAALRRPAARHRQAPDARGDRRGPGHVHGPRRGRRGAGASTILGRLRASERLRRARGRADPPSPAPGLPGPSRCRSAAATSTATCDACAPVGVDVTVLSVADRLATRGDNAERAIAAPSRAGAAAAGRGAGVERRSAAAADPRRRAGRGRSGSSRARMRRAACWPSSRRRSFTRRGRHAARRRSSAPAQLVADRRRSG